jgi:flagellar biosynthesis chaperone FliJ
MNEKEIEHFENFLMKAIQSTKQENSGLVDEIMHKMEKGIEESINRNVNGKIRNLDGKIDEYIKSDMEWKERYSPYLEGLQSISISGKILLWLAVFISSVVGAIKLLK